MSLMGTLAKELERCRGYTKLPVIERLEIYQTALNVLKKEQHMPTKEEINQAIRSAWTPSGQGQWFDQEKAVSDIMSLLQKEERPEWDKHFQEKFGVVLSNIGLLSLGDAIKDFILEEFRKLIDEFDAGLKDRTTTHVSLLGDARRKRGIE